MSRGVTEVHIEQNPMWIQPTVPQFSLLLCFSACSLKARAIISKRGDQVKKMKPKRTSSDREFIYGHGGS